MKRMTERDEFGNADILALSDKMPKLYDGLDFPDVNVLTAALNRLADYEDTGLSPNQVKSLMFRSTHNTTDIILDYYASLGVDADRLPELITADKEHRRPILPCKVGDKLWCINDNYEVEKVEAMGFIVGAPDEPVSIFYQEYGARDVYNSPIGGFLFLTREEAEAAVKRRKSE